MKKIIFSLALIGVTMFSCQKSEFSEGVDVPAKAQIKKVLAVSDAEWTPEDVKSSYTPGVGIALIGNEPISVFYADRLSEKEAEEFEF